METSKQNELRIATLNVLNNPSFFKQRFELAATEAEAKGVDILLLQEALYGELPALGDWLAARGWSSSALTDVEGLLHGPLTLSRSYLGEPQTSSIALSATWPTLPTPIPILQTDHDGITIFNGHFSWEAQAEHTRLQTALRVDELAEILSKDRLVIFGGDFNATLESSTLRFLRGLTSEPGGDMFRSTYWTSCWSGVEPFSTARKDGGWAKTTAARKGIVRPELLPDRTIDHLMSYGWNHGKVGGPLSLERFGESMLPDGRAISDHWGILVDFSI